MKKVFAILIVLMLLATGAWAWEVWTGATTEVGDKTVKGNLTIFPLQATISLKAFLNYSGYAVQDMIFKNDIMRVLAVDIDAGNQVTLWSVDVSNPESPTTIVQSAATLIDTAHAFCDSPRYIYAGSTGNQGFVYVDGSRPAVLTQTAMAYAGNTAIKNCVVHNGFLISTESASDGGLWYADLTIPTTVGTPVEVTNAAYNYGNALIPDGNYLYTTQQTADGSGNAKLAVSKFTSPNTLAYSTSITISDFVAAGNAFGDYGDIDGKNLWLVGWRDAAQANGKLIKVDISDPETPTSTVWEFTEIEGANAVAKSGNLIAVAVEGYSGSLINSNDLVILDYSSGTPVVLYTYSDSVDENFGHSVRWYGNYLVLAVAGQAGTSQGIRVFKVAGMDTPAAKIDTLLSKDINIKRDLTVGGNSQVGSIDIGAGGISNLGQYKGIMDFTLSENVANKRWGIRWNTSTSRIEVGTTTNNGWDFVTNGSKVATVTSGYGLTFPVVADPGTVSTDALNIFGYDIEAGAGVTSTLGLWVEQAVVSEVITCDATLLVRINNANYKVCLDAQ